MICAAATSNLVIAAFLLFCASRWAYNVIKLVIDGLRIMATPFDVSDLDTALSSVPFSDVHEFDFPPLFLRHFVRSSMEFEFDTCNGSAKDHNAKDRKIGR